MIPTVHMKVSVKFMKGIHTFEKREVRVTSVDWKRKTMTIEYETDMQGNGVHDTYSCLVSYDPFIKKYFASMLK